MENQKVSLGDRYAEITVVILTVIALIAGWFYKSSVENSSDRIPSWNRAKFS